MDKFCVFCGAKPKGKNKEHIIPKWLIEITGNPNRVVEFGPIWNSRTLSLERKTFAFDQFQFPSCDTCNQKYSNLENKAKDVVQCLINANTLASADFAILLDWLDKVRVGLWLAYNYLQKNISGVEPNYHINDRIGNCDRTVFIYKSDSTQLGINFTGANVPAFQYYPVCFNLRINQYCLFNISTDFLFSENLGIPYPKETYFTDGREIKFVMSKGKNKISYPLIKNTYNKKCTEIYQSILPKPEIREQISDLYQSNYAKSIMRNSEERRGNIFISDTGQIIEYPSDSSDIWIPKHIWKLPELMKMIGKQVFECQIYLIDQGPNLDEVNIEKKDLINKQHLLAKEVNKLYLRILEE